MTKTQWLKILLPGLVVAIGAAGAYTLFASKAKPETRARTESIPLVRVMPVELEQLRLSVDSQGTVSPRTESVLASEVAGRVIWVSPSFVSGGFFERGDPLLRVDAEDYREAVVRARASVTQAELRLASERAEAELARKEWELLGEGDASPLTLREPQLADARATVEAAVAALGQAERNLARTNILAPYAGRVRRANVDFGGWVAPGSGLGTIYAVDLAEIRLPIADDQLAFLDLPLVYRGDRRRVEPPAVILRAEFAGRTSEWRGTIVRTEGEIDPRSRLVHAVAQVDNPYGRGSDPDRPPLAVGMFVEAKILGRVVEDVAVVPRAALRGTDRVLIVDDDDRLRFRAVDVLRNTQEEVIVRSGLDAGDRVCLSPLSAVTDGMRVKPTESSRGDGT